MAISPKTVTLVRLRVTDGSHEEHGLYDADADIAGDADAAHALYHLRRPSRRRGATIIPPLS